MNIFQTFLDFSNYLGAGKAAIMVFAYFLGDFLIRKLPTALEAPAMHGNKLANFMLFDFAKKKSPVLY